MLYFTTKSGILSTAKHTNIAYYAYKYWLFEEEIFVIFYEFAV